MIEDEAAKLSKSADKVIIPWTVFFQSLKQAFNQKRVAVTVKKPSLSAQEPDMYVTTELSMGTLIGKHSLTLHLRYQNDTDKSLLPSLFINPLFEFYSVHAEMDATDKVSQMEKQLQRLKEKCLFLEKKALGEVNEQGEPFAEVVLPVKDRSKSLLPVTEAKTPLNNMDMPVQHVLSFLKDIKKKVVQSNCMFQFWLSCGN